MRAIWSGSISFGLVNIPIQLFSAADKDHLDFDLLHKKDLSPIRYARVCKIEEKEIPYDEIVKGYQYDKEKYVVLTDEDFERANIRLAKTIAILDFVKEEEIDPLYYEKPYYLKPTAESAHAYMLLYQSLMQSNLVGIGRYVLRNRERIAAIIPKNDLLIANQLRFKTEIRSDTELRQPPVSVDEREIKIAMTLINQLTKKFNPDDYRDTYTAELKKVIADKIAGRAPSIKGEVPKPTPTPDIMEMLQASLAKVDKNKTSSMK